eukprot:14384349-Alexandrium_andersonii.AAC.1
MVARGRTAGAVRSSPWAMIAMRLSAVMRDCRHTGLRLLAVCMRQAYMRTKMGYAEHVFGATTQGTA